MPQLQAGFERLISGNATIDPSMSPILPLKAFVDYATAHLGESSPGAIELPNYGLTKISYLVETICSGIGAFPDLLLADNALPQSEVTAILDSVSNSPTPNGDGIVDIHGGTNAEFTGPSGLNGLLWGLITNLDDCHFLFNLHGVTAQITKVGGIADINYSGNSFSVAEVNAILQFMIDNYIGSHLGWTLRLNGGTSGAPTGAGITNKNTLNGVEAWTVTTN